MKIVIKKAGLLTSVQDLGRMNYLSQAVPLSGAMDSLSAQMANIALGNDANGAVIEFTKGGAVFATKSDVLLALSGDGAYLCINEHRLPSDRPIFIPAETELYLENNRSGSRSYLAVAGGWDVPIALGSRSTYIPAKIGGLLGRCLVENDQLNNIDDLNPAASAIWRSLQGDKTNYPNWKIAHDLFLPADRRTIRVMQAQEFNWFDEPSKAAFFSKTYVTGHNSNRMGYHLDGAPMTRVVEDELLSTAVTPGTIQVSNNGGLILLMADCQTTGGYPRIAQVVSVDLPLCAQLNPGDNIRFKKISWKDAEKLYLQFKHDLRKLELAIAEKYV